MQRALLADPRAEPALSEWQSFRVETVGRFYAALRQTAHAINPAVDLRYNVHSPLLYSRYGIDPARLSAQVDSMRLKATPDLIREGVRMAVASGAAGVTASHYDCATFPLVRAVREGLAESGARP